MSKTPSILNDLIINNYKLTYIAEKNKVSKSYITMINKRVKQLKYKPRIIDNRIMCLECKELDNLCIHHNHDTGQPIAIICKKCNTRVGDKYEFKNGELSNYLYDNETCPYPMNGEYTTIQIKKSTAKNIKNIFKYSLTYNDLIDILIEHYKKISPERLEF